MGNFYTDVIKIDHRFGSTERVSDVQLLEPNVRRKVMAIIEDAKGHGLDLMVYETYRSQQRQQMLYQQGVTKLKNVGVHHFGLACDIVKVIHGEPSWDGSFDLIGHLAKNHDLIWGGNWGTPDAKHTFVDQPHVQWCSLKDQKALFAGAWYPDPAYNPYEHI